MPDTGPTTRWTPPWPTPAVDAPAGTPTVPKPSQRMSFVVDSFARPQWLLWRSRVRIWAWRLVPLTDGRTRMISRLRTFYEWRRPGTLVTVLLMELGDYPMVRRMLGGIRERAEAERQRCARSSWVAP